MVGEGLGIWGASDWRWDLGSEPTTQPEMLMGAQQNAERLRGGYDAFNRADIVALTD